MTLELQLAVFRQTEQDNRSFYKEKFDSSKKYPDYKGTVKVPVGQIEEFISYLKNAKPDNDGYVGDFIPLRASGYTNTPKNNPNGKKFLALKIETDYKKQKEIYEGGSMQPQMTNRNPVDAPLGSDEIDF
tara:strand:- start:247 stop:636 length:390 start_codon:yes stop_codon:yes gene_type:complete